MRQCSNLTMWRQQRASSWFSLNSASSLQRVKGNALIAGQIDAQLELKVISSCLEELKQFPKRYVNKDTQTWSYYYTILYKEQNVTVIFRFDLNVYWARSKHLREGDVHFIVFIQGNI